MSKAKDRLDAAYVKEVLDYDPATGEFRWKARPSATPQWNGKYAGRKAGSINDHGYVIIAIDGIDCRAHRVAWAIMTGAWPAEEVDHENLYRADNRWANLRSASHSQNNHNKAAQSNNTSGFKGVSYCRLARKWVARTMIDGKYKVVGKADTAEGASIAYRDASKLHHGDFARTTKGME